MPDLLATVQGRIDPVSVTVSGEYKHYTRMMRARISIS